ncbi:HAD family hydrolase [Halocynthiibacter namhaensis]|uniref:HAD family hydrolase n=1 Tax=Halocynthiibacter namhaensis TaxID=1290553 RepID=UPI000578F0B8|nr:HAD family hydrolase [Halocynthiibacter namhaensis]
MARDIGALLFDKDGTLFDFEGTWGQWAVRALAEITETPEAAKVLGDHLGVDSVSGKFRADSVVIAGTPHEIVAEVRLARPDFDAGDLYNTINRIATEVVPVEVTPLPPLLKTFRDMGMKLGVCTNDTLEPAYANLNHAGVREDFDMILGSDSGYTPKPAPDGLLAFAKHVGVDPTRCAMVGDSLHDLQSGRAAGMVTIAVLTGVAETPELAPFADVVLPDISHIPAWLAQD